jgi:ATPase family protein associated with various cellular activities (AAA)
MSNQKAHQNQYSDHVRLVLEDRAESASPRVILGVSGATKMNLLLDVLLSDTREMALVKITLATEAARSDIKFTRDHMTRFKQDSWDVNRRRCGHFVRRLHRDESGLDLLWLMLAAAPGKPWTYSGWLPRLTDALNTMSDQATPIEEGLLWIATNRYSRWVDIAAGCPAFIDDPFKAVTDKEWARAEARRIERDNKARAAAAMIANNNPPVSIKELRSTNFDDLESARLAPPQDAAQEVAGEVSDGVQVLPTDSKMTGLYRALSTSRTPLDLTPDDIRPIRDVLRAEFPHAYAAIDLMLGDLRPGEPLRFRPFLLLGSPGSGKSRLVRRMCEFICVKLRRYDGAGSSDNAFGGTPKRWASATPCVPLQAVAEAKVANPVMLIDEVDKAGRGIAGCLTDSLMPFLETETSRAFPDPCFEVEADLSYVNYCMTANGDTRLPSPLRDRIRIIRVPAPTVEHLDALARSIMADLAVELNIPPTFLHDLAPDELSVVSKMWGENGSVRRLQKIIRGTVTARDQYASRH